MRKIILNLHNENENPGCIIVLKLRLVESRATIASLNVQVFVI